MRIKWAMAAIVVIMLIAAIIVTRSGLFQERPVPAVAVTTLNGDQYRLDSMGGHVVLVNFWATTCAVCIRDMPKLIDLFEKYRSRGYRTVAVAMPYDPPNRVIDYTTRRSLPFDVVLDIDGAVLRAFGDVPGTPTSFLVDKTGKIIRKYLGEPDFTELEERIQEELVAG